MSLRQFSLLLGFGQMFDPPNSRDDFADLERLSLDLVQTLRVNEEFRPQEHAELAEVQLGDDDRFKTREDFLQILGEGVEVFQMDAGDGMAGLLQVLHGGRDRSVGSRPWKSGLGTRELLHGRATRRSGCGFDERGDEFDRLSSDEAVVGCE